MKVNSIPTICKISIAVSFAMILALSVLSFMDYQTDKKINLLKDLDLAYYHSFIQTQPFVEMTNSCSTFNALISSKVDSLDDVRWILLFTQNMSYSFSEQIFQDIAANKIPNTIAIVDDYTFNNRISNSRIPLSDQHFIIMPDSSLEFVSSSNPIVLMVRNNHNILVYRAFDYTLFSYFPNNYLHE